MKTKISNENKDLELALELFYVVPRERNQARKFSEHKTYRTHLVKIAKRHITNALNEYNARYPGKRNQVHKGILAQPQIARMFVKTLKSKKYRSPVNPKRSVKQYNSPHPKNKWT